jgi:hypothetical protein
MELVTMIVIVEPIIIVILFLFVPPRYIRRIARDAIPLDDPEDVGEAIASAVESFFSGHTITNEKGEEEEINAGAMALMFGQGLVVAAVQVGMPIVMEELPVLIASMHTHKWGESMREKSAVARGVDGLPKGSKGYQAFQHGMKTFVSGVGQSVAGKVMPEMPKAAKEIVGWVQAIPMIKEGIAEVRNSGILGGNEPAEEKEKKPEVSIFGRTE